MCHNLEQQFIPLLSQISDELSSLHQILVKNFSTLLQKLKISSFKFLLPPKKIIPILILIQFEYQHSLSLYSKLQKPKKNTKSQNYKKKSVNSLQCDSVSTKQNTLKCLQAFNKHKKKYIGMFSFRSQESRKPNIKFVSEFVIKAIF